MDSATMFCGMKRHHEFEKEQHDASASASGADTNPFSKPLSRNLLIKILTFLPFTTLLRFKSVCKQWYHLISSSTFMTLHLNHHKIKPFFQESENPFLCNLLSVISTTFYGPRPKTPCCAVVGCAEGFVCFRCNYLVQSFCLFDINKRDFVFLSECDVKIRPRYGCDGGIITIHCGFGFIAETGDYKLVVIAIGNDLAVEVNLYTKSSNSWKKISTSLPCFMVQFSVCTLNGKLFLGTGVDETTGEYVVYFHMVEEKFYRIRWVRDKPYFLQRLVILDQSLVMFACPDVWNEQFDCWVLDVDDDGRFFWKKVISIGPLGLPFEPLGFWPNDSLLLATIEKDNDLRLWLYDPFSQSTTKLDDVRVRSQVCLPCVCQVAAEK